MTPALAEKAVTRMTPHAEAPLPATIEECHALIRSLQSDTLELRHAMNDLVRRLFGPRTERTDPNQGLLFASPEPVMPESEVQPQPAKPASQPRKGHGRGLLSRHLPRQRVEHDVPEQEKVCPCCGKPKERIGEEISEQLDYQPASVVVV